MKMIYLIVDANQDVGLAPRNPNRPFGCRDLVTENTRNDVFIWLCELGRTVSSKVFLTAVDIEEDYHFHRDNVDFLRVSREVISPTLLNQKGKAMAPDRNSISFVPRLLPAPQAAAYLGISETNLTSLKLSRKILGGKRLYDRLTLDAYADNLATEGESVPDKNEW